MPGPKKRTIIVDGEIYSGEDDPRYIAYLQRRAGASGSHRSESRPPQGTPAPQGPGTMSTPPLRLSTGPPGWLGLPDVEFAQHPAAAVVASYVRVSRVRGVRAGYVYHASGSRSGWRCQGGGWEVLKDLERGVWGQGPGGLGTRPDPHCCGLTWLR
ncbi:hypothetical protein HaLaN_15201 [Haematococcus lacustris]|uniref:Uncharacterized protein n=1 Tax=Haematococcus lacustris TaxID=44745 RepID=A0A699ZR34_HAELA|nr:hypothetical protein HaLaN_15201 [Haematococcus lacustris]